MDEHPYPQGRPMLDIEPARDPRQFRKDLNSKVARLPPKGLRKAIARNASTRRRR